MKTIISILAILIGAHAHAATYSDFVNTEFSFNQMSGVTKKLSLGTKIQRQRLHAIKCVYDFAAKGGAVGAISLVDESGISCVIPKKAIIRDVLIDVLTAPTSGGSATLAFSSGQGAADLKTATAIASITGLVAGVPVGSAATAIKMTADHTPTMTIATAALTAGKINVHIEYEMGD